MYSANLRIQRVDVAASLLLSLWVISGSLVIALLVALWHASGTSGVDPITLGETGRGEHAIGFCTRC